MDVELTGSEVLEIAEKIERNGAKFYRKAAVICDDPGTSRFFVKLAQWEARHVEIFRRMKKELTERSWDAGRPDPGRLDGQDAQAMAALAVFGIRADPADELNGDESREAILRLAIEKEKDSIVYYTGLKGFVPRDVDRQVVNDVIEEEMKHVRILVQALQQTT